jgi:glucose/arabinose dehydrogenase
MRFAPGGELFVSSPSRGTTSGGLNGHAAIVLMPDDNHDGTADAILTFLSDLPSTQGLLFANDRLYYQDSTRIMSMPYQLGDRVPRAPATAMANITIFQATEHWPKTLDISDDGTIYVGNGGDQDEVCDPTRPFRGGILELDGSEGGTPVAKGLRNPIDVRCARGNDRCFALELGLDHSASEGGREKLIPIRQGDDWGFPCCATQNVPFEGLDEAEAAVCADVAPDADTFLIGDTPFGIEFEQGRWPAPWKKEAFIAMHGAAGGDGRPWAGARIVAIAMDPTTGLPLPSTDALGADIGAMTDFATGWDDGTLEHGRPTAIAFSDDGRLFVGDDQKGVIFWIAAMTQ